MSDQLSKPLVGQYKFLNTADRSATLVNLRIQGSASVELVPVANAVALNGNLGCLFFVEVTGSTTFTLSNITNGQIINILVSNAAVGAVTLTFTSTTGTLTTLASGAVGLYTLYKVASTTYVKGDDL